ncbi:MAG TPA: CHAT domain-containing protein, partial [Pyrinomonadaceae bacterium]|nr:CHAT domain-containing protein [Pyrinomonadaceae bacterium]
MNDSSQGQLSDSARNLKMALQLAEDTGNVFEIQHAEDGLAKHYEKLGEFQPAWIYAGKRFSHQGSYYQRSPTQYWRDLGTLAELTANANFPFTSLSISKEALAFATANSFKDALVTDSLRHVIEASIATNDLTGALNHANTSLQLALKRGDATGSAITKAETYRLLGDINRQGKNCPEALGQYDQALEMYSRLPEVTIGAYRIHKGKLACFQQLDDAEKFDAELKIVLALTEEYRHNIREDSSRQAFFDSQQDIFDAATEHAIRAGDPQRAFGFVEAAKARSLLQFIQSSKSIAEVESGFGSVAKRLDLAEIQSRLPEQVQLVQYEVLPDTLAIWTVSKTGFDFHQKQISAAELEQKVTDFQSAIRSQANAGEVRRAGRELYGILMPPRLDPEKSLCIIADKFLHQLAFAALVSAQGNYLLQDHLLFYAPSASILVVASENARRKAPAAKERLLSVGDPDFDREENPGLPDLPDAEAEAQTIAEIYPGSIRLGGRVASKQNFLRKLEAVEVVHFAGHFLANAEAPGNSKLLLAGGDLRSAELASFKLPKLKLVVLSACETGYEGYNLSEGSIGIARTFLALGAPVVLATQWKVESAATRNLMIAFHRNRRQRGMSSAESLRQAQL